MGYYGTLNLAREPFSNSPDPGLFYNSSQHLEALQQLEISIRLKRGLNVVTGDVGTGKTTLSRQLIQMFSRDDTVNMIVILDPGFNRVIDFLSYILQLFKGTPPPRSLDENQIKEQIKNFLFTQSVDLGKLTVMIVDEGQKMTIPCLEALRELLNYETNDHKLLQIIIFAQKEFNRVLNSLENLRDRVNLHYSLGALNFRDTRGLVLYRLEQSFEAGKKVPIFSLGALWVLYRASQGYPRKIVKLCHHVILAMIIQERKKADFFLVRSCAGKILPGSTVIGRVLPVIAILALAASATAVYIPMTGKLKPPLPAPVEQPIDVAPVSRAEPTPDLVKLDSAAKVMAPGPDVPEQPMVMPAISQPTLLGTLTIEKNELLCDLVTAIYGFCTNSIISHVLKFNPEISDPGTILAGTSIVFPVPPFSFKAGSDSRYVIVLSTWQTLKDAYSQVRRFHQGDFPVNSLSGTTAGSGPISRYSSFAGIHCRILPVWSADLGLAFHVIVDKPQDTMEDAEALIKGLQEVMTATLKTFTAWDRETVIYEKRN
ncbi:MAG: AAA family ATPase [Pseudomonadota bacterium]